MLSKVHGFACQVKTAIDAIRAAKSEPTTDLSQVNRLAYSVLLPDSYSACGDALSQNPRVPTWVRSPAPVNGHHGIKTAALSAAFPKSSLAVVESLAEYI